MRLDSGYAVVMNPDLTTRPGRQYVFRTRRCRQRIAQRLGAGQQPVRVAAVERLPLVEVEMLARDPAMAALVQHYRALEALDPATRRGRLVSLAAAMLERLVATGDLRAIAFVLHEERMGRDPAGALADAAWRAVECSRARVVPEGGPHPGLRARPGAGSLPPPPQERGQEGTSCSLSRRQVGEGRGEGISGRGEGVPPPPAGGRTGAGAHPAGPWAFCAAVQPDAVAAADLAMREVAALPQQLRRMAGDLRRRLVDEVEREGTAEAVAPAVHLAAEAGRIGRRLHDEAGQALVAARTLEAHRCTLEAGGLPDAKPEARGPPPLR